MFLRESLSPDILNPSFKEKLKTAIKADSDQKVVETMVEYPQTILIFTLPLHFVINYLKVCLETQDTICTSRKQLRHKNLPFLKTRSSQIMNSHCMCWFLAKKWRTGGSYFHPKPTLRNSHFQLYWDLLHTHTKSPLVYQMVSTAACMSKALLIHVSRWGAVGIWSYAILCCTEMSHVLQGV